MIKVNSLEFGYSRNQRLFQDLSFSIESGKIYGLLGLNGAGKTTLLKLLSATLFPKRGEILLNGQNVSNRSVDMLEKIFLVPEEFLLPQITVERFVNFNSGFYPQFNLEQFHQVMREFELEDNPILTRMSYGQKKKFLIAFGIATNVPVLMLDEPSNGLDIPSKSQFRKIMVNAVSENRTFLISTHQVRDLASMIDHVLMIHNGRIVFDRSLEEIQTRLAMGIVDEHKDQILYTEETLGGKKAIYPNDGKYSEVDLELLFNGILAKEKEINKFFSPVE